MSKVGNSLNFMYNMEQFATRIYLVQRSAFKGSDVADKLTAASANEQTHTDFLRAQILELKLKPSHLGCLFKTAAVIVGGITRILGKSAVLNAAIFVEKRAVRDYGNYVKQVKFDEKTVALLKRIIADEVRHVETWQSSLATLRGKKTPAV
ncbi:MAG: ferritin-like domain-containing protein [Dehalococcoidales bacterium]|nr:ferritin-like domain-containing protein [Dehalococcoidales bacterium]